MPVASIFNPALGKHFKFGRLVSDPNSKKLHFHNYSKKLAAPPATADWSSKSPKSMADIFENDDLGDCVIADNCRAIGIVTGLNGAEFVTPTSDVTSEYGAIGGYIPGESSTDNGCDPETALRYYSTVGYANGVKLAAWMAVDATNQTLVMQGIFELCNGAAAMNLPDAWVSPMPSASGFVWDVVGPPNPAYGHEFTIYGYTAQGLKIDTWGLLGIMTWAAAAKYLVPSAQGALYLRLFADLVGNSGKSPSGFPWAQVVADFNAMGGTVPIPIPAPGPTPTTDAVASYDFTTSTMTVPSGWSTFPFPSLAILSLVQAVPLPDGWTITASTVESRLKTATVNWLALLAAIAQEAPQIEQDIAAILAAAGLIPTSSVPTKK